MNSSLKSKNKAGKVAVGTGGEREKTASKVPKKQQYPQQQKPQQQNFKNERNAKNAKNSKNPSNKHSREELEEDSQDEIENDENGNAEPFDEDGADYDDGDDDGEEEGNNIEIQKGKIQSKAKKMKNEGAAGGQKENNSQDVTKIPANYDQKDDETKQAKDYLLKGFIFFFPPFNEKKKKSKKKKI